MTIDQFTRLLDTYGADLARWPEAERRAGEAFLAGSAEARGRHAAAARLDGLFALDRALTPDPVRVNAIADEALRRIRKLPPRGFDWRFLFSKPVGAAFAATVLAGWVAGLYLGPALSPPEPKPVPAVGALLGVGAGLEELL